MRVLHAIHQHETLICRGSYHYLRDGVSTGDVETWLVTRLPDGKSIVRADLDGRNGTGANLVTHLLRKPDDQPEWLRIRYRADPVNSAAQYTFEEALVKIARLTEGHIQRQGTLEIAENYGVDYHPVIAHDYVWRGYPDNANGETRFLPIFSPDLWSEGEHALKGRALRYGVTPLPPGDCPVPAGRIAVGAHFGITLNDGVEAEAWFAENGVPLRWVYPAKGYEFLLATYKAG